MARLLWAAAFAAPVPAVHAVVDLDLWRQSATQVVMTGTGTISGVPIYPVNSHILVIEDNPFASWATNGAEVGTRISGTMRVGSAAGWKDITFAHASAAGGWFGADQPFIYVGADSRLRRGDTLEGAVEIEFDGATVAPIGTTGDVRWGPSFDYMGANTGIWTIRPGLFFAPFYADTPHTITQGPGGEYSHTGLLANDVDFAAGSVPILASRSGVANVFLATNGNQNHGFGNYVTIDHGVSPVDSSQRLFSLYAHLEEVFVDDGRVFTSQIIGTEGQTGGVSTGVHLHWGLYSGDPRAVHPFASNWVPLELEAAAAGMMLGEGPGGPYRLFDTAELGLETGSLIYSSVARPEVLAVEQTVGLGETQRFAFYVSGGRALSTILRWPGSELALDVSGPGGAFVQHLQDTDGSIEFRLEDAIAGTWNFSITGIDVTAGGEPYSFTIEETALPLPGGAWLAGSALGVLGLMHATRRRRMRGCIRLPKSRC